MNQAIFDRNILSLGSTDPLLASRLGWAELNPRVRFVLSKTHKTVAVLDTPEGARALHSLFDPEREGTRLAETYAPEGFFLFLGFGCAYHILPCLGRSAISRIVILDTDMGLLKAVLGEVDLRALLLDSRVRFLIDPSAEELRAFILSNYFPSLAGDFRTISLRSRVDSEKDFFLDRMRVIKESLDALSDDFTVQSHFGKKWFINTLSNLEAAEKSSTVLVPKRRAIVTGAGPSLEDAIPAIQEERKDCLLIASDTSLPVLLQNGLRPDLVVSIDCQHITYNHFMAGYPRDVPLALDLASPPIITKLTPKMSFFTSSHPFSQYVNSHWRQFPFIDTSGGNVSQAAVSLADRMGVQQILVYGADFSYPEGKSYAREAYVYPYFRSRESRLNSIESLFIHFLFRNQTVSAVWKDGAVRYTSKPMIRYKERLENASRYLRAELIPAPGKGEAIVIQRRETPRSHVSPLFSAGTGKGSWTDFLKTYRERILALPPPRNPVMSYIHGLSQEEKYLWMTLLPVSAVFVKTLSAEKPGAPELLALSRDWTLEAVTRCLRQKSAGGAEERQ
jgi:hypothetical protein